MPDILDELQATINERKRNPKPGSYTNRLLDEGLNRIAQKVGEEAVEVVVSALGQEREQQIGELCDLFYHSLVLMAALDITIYDVFAELERRHKPSQGSAS
ncbi:phosphoribosyl-ATP diphosphatase [Kamptonema cortianum]|nr:phosphoribosyl-ATP diphosphatase [Kamptonema cortianum]